MKKKNGFTFVELMAVIVLVSVLLTIASTAVINTMNRTKLKAETLAAKDYVTAVNDYNLMSKANEKISNTNGSCTTPSGNSGVYVCSVANVSPIIKDAITGNLPTSGTITIDKTTYKVTSASIKVKKYTISYDGVKYTKES